MQNKLETFTATSGQLSARVILDDDSIRHLHSTVKPEAESDFYKDLSFWGTVIVFCGIGLGYHLADKKGRIPPSALLIVIDCYDELIDHNINITLANLPNTILTISSTDFDRKKAVLLKSLKEIPSPLFQIIKHPASYNVNNDFYEKVLSSIYPPIIKSPPSRKPTKKPFLCYGKFFLQEECRRAFQIINYEDPVLFNYEAFHSELEYESQLQKTIQTEKPDFILSINMKGFDGNGILSTTTERLGIPVIVWFVDDPHPILLHQGEFIGKHMTAMCWEKTYLPYLEKCGFKDSTYLPLATDTNIFSHNTIAEPTIPLGFVGSSMGKTFLADIQSKFLWKGSLYPLVENASDIFLHSPQEKIATIIQNVSRELSIPLPFSDNRNLTWLCSYTIHTASMKKRKMIINSLLNSNIELFGDPHGWKELLGQSIKTHPDIDYNTQLCNTYRTIAINLNITSCQMATTVNQRVFDIPMSGSFVISDNQKDMEELFDVEQEAVCYKDTNELKDLIDYYTKNETERLSIITSAQNRIKNEHTYKNRIQTILNC